MSLSHAIGKRQPCVRNEVKHLYLKVATFGGLIVVVFPGLFNLFFFLFFFLRAREKCILRLRGQFTAGKFMEKGDENEVFKVEEPAVISAYSFFITFLIVNYTARPQCSLHIIG